MRAISIIGALALVALALSFGESEARIFLHTDEVSWFEAQNHCRRCGRQLVVVDSAAKTAEINELIDQHNADDDDDTYWTSGNDLAENDDFVWASSGQDFGAYVNWEKNQPNGREGQQNCIGIDNKKWYDLDCTDKNYFLCEDVDFIM